MFLSDHNIDMRLQEKISFKRFTHTLFMKAISLLLAKYRKKVRKERTRDRVKMNYRQK